jgi:hypothetical protein
MVDEVKKDRELHNWAWTNPIEPAYAQTPPRWMSPIFMPRAASRLTLEILNIRVERVREISERDAYMEGIDRSPTMPHPIAWYRDLWNSINAKRGYPWADNPWVWAISFRVLP